jgi:hypothetical protein
MNPDHCRNWYCVPKTWLRSSTLPGGKGMIFCFCTILILPIRHGLNEDGHKVLPPYSQQSLSIVFGHWKTILGLRLRFCLSGNIHTDRQKMVCKVFSGL